MDHRPDGSPPLVAAPRHLRRRRFHGDIPDALLVEGGAPVTLKPLESEAPPAAAEGHAESRQLGRELLRRRKRFVALLAVLVVVVCLPVLVLALLFG